MHFIVLCLYLYCLDNVSCDCFPFWFCTFGYFVHSYIICVSFIEWHSLFLSVYFTVLATITDEWLVSKDEYNRKWYVAYRIFRFLMTLRLEWPSKLFFFKVIHLLQAFSNASPRTYVLKLTRFQKARSAISLR